jgi:hypothetical protein
MLACGRNIETSSVKHAHFELPRTTILKSCLVESYAYNESHVFIQILVYNHSSINHRNHMHDIFMCIHRKAHLYIIMIMII